MKKITIYIVLALLYLVLKANAQQNKATDVTAAGIKIGQPVPDISINPIHNYKTATAKLSDFKGKLLLLDFWATWCSPCVAMIPRMDSLQKQFGDKVQFLSVTYQTDKEVMPFLDKLETQQKKHYNLPVVTSSKELHRLFPHVSLPHYVWIDGNGVVKAITESKDVSYANISKMLSGKSDMEKKSDFKIAYDSTKPFLINGNGGDGSNLIYHSVLTKYIIGLGSQYDTRKDSSINGRRFVFTNENITNLFAFAFGEGKNWFQKNRIKVDVKEPSNLLFKFSNLSASDWVKQNQYCYEIIVPPYLEREIYKLMQDDLTRFFPLYKVSVKKERLKCAVLERTSAADKISYKGGELISKFNSTGFNLNGYYLSRLISQLTFTYLQNSEYPIIDSTGYSGKISILGDANLTNIQSINNALAKYDLTFNIKDEMIDVLVIEDSNIN